MAAIIETSGLSKTFNALPAVQDLSFTINAGDVYGFLGQNGAGKSTTMRMLLGLIRPDAGTIKIKGEDFSNNKRHLLKYIGAIIERPDLYGYLSGWDNLKIFAKLSGTKIPDKRLYDLLELVSLKGREKDKVKGYSQGMKQRLGIAIALVHDPELLILDEPTNGLDPQGIAEMRNLIINLSEEHGKTVLISSHLLNEIEQIATRMIIIHKGKKIVEGSVGALLNPEDTLMEIEMEQHSLLANSLRTSQWADKIQDISNTSFTLKMHPKNVPDLNNWLVAEGVRVKQLQARHSLEAYFLNLTHAAATQD